MDESIINGAKMKGSAKDTAGDNSSFDISKLMVKVSLN